MPRSKIAQAAIDLANQVEQMMDAYDETIHGALVAVLVATYLSRFNSQIRAELLEFHIDTVRGLLGASTQH